MSAAKKWRQTAAGMAAVLARVGRDDDARAQGAARRVAVLFARSDSVYKSIEGLDVFDLERDARSFAGGVPVVAHPPCRAWGRLRAFARPRADEKDLALFAVDCVRRDGGVLEHPAFSSLWPGAGLPLPGVVDAFGGFTLPVSQHWWGHKAEKRTFLYVVGCGRSDLPDMPLVLGDASHVVNQSGRRADGGRLRRGDARWRPEISKGEREHTPINFARWLVDLAVICGGGGGK